MQRRTLRFGGFLQDDAEAFFRPENTLLGSKERLQLRRCEEVLLLRRVQRAWESDSAVAAAEARARHNESAILIGPNVGHDSSSMQLIRVTPVQKLQD